MMPLTLSDGLEEKEMLNSSLNRSFELLRRVIEKMGFLKNPDPFQRKMVTGFLDGIVVTRVPKKDTVTCGYFRLEPHAVKVARVVPRGERISNDPDLLDCIKTIMWNMVSPMNPTIVVVSQPQGRGMVQRVEQPRKSKCRPVIGRIGSIDPT